MAAVDTPDPDVMEGVPPGAELKRGRSSIAQPTKRGRNERALSSSFSKDDDSKDNLAQQAKPEAASERGSVLGSSIPSGCDTSDRKAKRRAQMLEHLDKRGLTHYHKLFLNKKGMNCKSTTDLRSITKAHVKQAARRVDEYKTMTDEMCQEVAQAARMTEREVEQQKAVAQRNPATTGKGREDKLEEDGSEEQVEQQQALSWKFKGMPHGFGKSPDEAAEDWQKVVLDAELPWPNEEKVSLDDIAKFVRTRVPDAIGFTRHPNFDSGRKLHRKVTAFRARGEAVQHVAGQIRWPLFIYEYV
jgi:hypothetical protein